MQRDTTNRKNTSPIQSEMFGNRVVGIQMRKGEITKRRINRDFPHQVAILIPEGGLVARLMAMHKFCTTPAMPRG